MRGKTRRHEKSRAEQRRGEKRSEGQQRDKKGERREEERKAEMNCSGFFCSVEKSMATDTPGRRIEINIENGFGTDFWVSAHLLTRHYLTAP